MMNANPVLVPVAKSSIGQASRATGIANQPRGVNAINKPMNSSGGNTVRTLEHRLVR